MVGLTYRRRNKQGNYLGRTRCVIMLGGTSAGRLRRETYGVTGYLRRGKVGGVFIASCGLWWVL